jgi:HEAT repeat protein
MNQLHDTNANVRSQAALSLGNLRAVEAVDALLITLCTDSELNVQEDATWALTRMGDAAVLPLVGAMSDPDPKVRHNIAHTLGKLKDLRAEDTLITVLQDQDAAVRLKAAFALGQLRSVKAITPLTALLSDTNLDVQYTAAEVLVSFGEVAIGALVEVLQHSHSDPRAATANILGHIASAAAIPVLTAALHDPEWQVRFAVVNALGAIRDQQVSVLLEQASHDAHPHVRSLATKLLKRSLR